MYLLKYYKNSYLSYFLMYFFFFFSLAFFSGLLSVYLMDQGFSASQVSFVVSCSFILSVIVQPFIGKLNDVYESKYVNGVLLLIAGLLGIIFMFLKNIYLIALVYSLVLSITNGTNPIIERMAVLSRFKYGSIRVWATQTRHRTTPDHRNCFRRFERSPDAYPELYVDHRGLFSSFIFPFGHGRQNADTAGYCFRCRPVCFDRHRFDTDSGIM